MKIIVTGGHLSPALAVIDRLAQEKNIQIIFVGRKYNLIGDKSESLEYQEITKRKISFTTLETGRAIKEISRRSLIDFFRTFRALINSFIFIAKERPHRILSFGGYIAFPICLIGFILRIPIYTHEQTIHPGLANRFIAKLSRKVFIAFPESRRFFPLKKTILTGNPIKRSVLTVNKVPFIITKSKPVVLVIGGSLGSHSINSIISSIVPELLKSYIVIHQTGSVTEYDDFQKLGYIKARLPKNLSKNYFLKKHFYDDELGAVYQAADLVVSRSGANTFFELLALKKPTIFIPLPWSAYNEQEKHANLFRQAGAGEIFYQNQSPKLLLLLIRKVLTHVGKYQEGFRNLNISNSDHAAETIVETVLYSS